MALFARPCRVLAVLCLAVCLLAGCGRSDAPELRLGFVATFSGEDFRSGRDALDAARFAVETATREGRPAIGGRACRIRLFVRDAKASPETAAKAVRELITRERVTAIIGPYTSETANAAALAADKAGVPLVTPSATADIVTAGRPHIFRIAFTDDFEGTVLAWMVLRELRAKRIAVLTDQGDLASRALAQAFIRTVTACGGHSALFSYASRERDFQPVLRQVLDFAPDVLFLPNPSKDAVLQGLAARKLGFRGTLLGGDAWDGPEISRLKAFTGALFVDHWRADAPGQRSRAYAAAFRQARDRPATEVGALTQDAVDVVLLAVARTQSTAPAAITRELMDMPPFDGVTGRFDFVRDGNPVKSLFLTRVTNGGTRLDTMVVSPPEPCRPR